MTCSIPMQYVRLKSSPIDVNKHISPTNAITILANNLVD